MTLTVLPPFKEGRDLLPVVDRFDLNVPYAQWRAQLLVPATFKPVEADRRPWVFVVVNQKGGAGKTTTAAELAAAWASRGFRVRVIDADHQEAAISKILVPLYPAGLPAAERYTLKDVYTETATLDQATLPTKYQNIWIVPSDQSLAEVEYNPAIVGGENALKYGLADSEKEIDIDIIDCGPSLGTLSVSALVAADYAIVPTGVSNLDIQGMASLSKTVTTVQRRANPNLRVVATVMTAWDRSLLAREIGARLAEDYPEAVVALARRAIRAAESPAVGLLQEYDPYSTTTSDYNQLGEALIPRSFDRGE